MTKTEKQETALSKAKFDIKRIKRFCNPKNGAIPSQKELTEFLAKEELEYYSTFATTYLQALTEEAWILFSNKTNRNR